MSTNMPLLYCQGRRSLSLVPYGWPQMLQSVPCENRGPGIVRIVMR